MTNTLAISSAILWLQTNNVLIPADIQMYMRREMKVLDPRILSNIEREAKFTRALEALMLVYREKVMRALARGAVSQRLTDALREELYHALQLNYYDAALDRLPQIAANFGVPVESPFIEELLYEWSTKQARDVSEQITKITLQRLDSLIRLRQDEGLLLEAEEIQKLLDFTFGEARVTTIAITETTTARNMIVDIYRMQLDKLGIPNDERWLTSEDERVCEICGPADHKLKNQPIDEGDWEGRTWGERFPYLKPHPRCRCEKVLERSKELVIPQSLKGGEGSGFFGHAGRPGEVGGSMGEGSGVEHVDSFTGGKAIIGKDGSIIRVSGGGSHTQIYARVVMDNPIKFGSGIVARAQEIISSSLEEDSNFERQVQKITGMFSIEQDFMGGLTVKGEDRGDLNSAFRQVRSYVDKGKISLYQSTSATPRLTLHFDNASVSMTFEEMYSISGFNTDKFKPVPYLKGGAGSGDLEGHEFRGNQYTEGRGEGTIYYRGEYAKLKDDIRVEGIAGKKLNGRPKSVYMTKSREDAHLYGVQKTNIGESYVIVEILVPAGYNVVPDERDTKLVYGRSSAVRYQGNVPPEWVVSINEYEITSESEGAQETEIARINSLKSKNGEMYYIPIILKTKILEAKGGAGSGDVD